jgi:hypothetical protein
MIVLFLKYNSVYNVIETMVDLRCHNCKRVFQFARQPEDNKFYTNALNVILKCKLQGQETMVEIIPKFTIKNN